jgi:release factor glutamine methyltransferase
MLPLRLYPKLGETELRDGPYPERAALDSEVLLLHALERDRIWLMTHRSQGMPEEAGKRFSESIKRRLAGEPIQYITGETEFYGLPFRVTQDVLIPRPETEHLVETVIAFAAQFSKPRIVDIGTGSGAIAISLAHKLQDSQITAIDISGEALAVARQNSKLNSVDETIRFLRGDLLAPVTTERFEIIASNPPYVPSADRDSLSVEVRDHEPALALFAGEDGLAIYRRLIPAAYAQLVSRGFLALEIGYGQQEAIRALLGESGFAEIEFLPDLQQIPRVASARKP